MWLNLGFMRFFFIYLVLTIKRLCLEFLNNLNFNKTKNWWELNFQESEHAVRSKKEGLFNKPNLSTDQTSVDRSPRHHVENTEVTSAPLGHRSLDSTDLYPQQQLISCLTGPDTRRIVRFSNQLFNTSDLVTKSDMKSANEKAKTLIDTNDGLINSKSERSVSRQKSDRFGNRTNSFKSSFSTSKEKRRDYLKQLEYLSDGSSRDSSPDL